MKQIDARGMSCPQPVLMTQKALEGNTEEFEILVDNNTAKENIKRYALHAGCKIDVRNEADDFVIQIRK